MVFSADYLIEIILFLGAIQSFILGMVLLIKRGVSSRKYLAFFLILIALILVGNLFQRNFAWWYGALIDPLVLLLGPCLYFYIVGFSERVDLNKLRIHLLFPTFYLLIITWFTSSVLIEHGWAFSLEDFIESYYNGHPILFFLAISKIGHLLFYSFLSLKAQKIHELHLINFYSELTEVNLRWFRRLIYTFLAIILLTMISFSAQFLSKNLIFTIAGLNLGLLTVFVYYIAYNALQQPAIFIGNLNFETELQAKSADQIKYKSNKLDSSVSEILKTEIIGLMESKKLYLESELSIQQLAQEMNQSVHAVSQVLNDVIGLNFYEFVNKYRVEEAKNLLRSNAFRHLNILAIGLQAGFNSKTSFNTAFKKYTGLTPSKYQKLNL